METPLEKLRNKLTPFMNLVEMLEDQHISNDFFLTTVIRSELKQCKNNAKFIKKHLNDIEKQVK